MSSDSSRSGRGRKPQGGDRLPARTWRSERDRRGERGIVNPAQRDTGQGVSGRGIGRTGVSSGRSGVSSGRSGASSGRSRGGRGSVSSGRTGSPGTGRIATGPITGPIAAAITTGPIATGAIRTEAAHQVRHWRHRLGSWLVGNGNGGGLDTPLDASRRNRRSAPVDTERFGRASERFARFMGTASFLVGMTAFVGGWLAWNWLAPTRLQFDPRELNFTLLTLLLSLQASYAAPLILLAQNRQADRDRVAAEQDRDRAERALADTEYLAREVAALRIALGEVATRDFVRSELRSLLEEYADPRTTADKPRTKKKTGGPGKSVKPRHTTARSGTGNAAEPDGAPRGPVDRRP